MIFTPHISIYPDNDTTQAEFGHVFLKSTWLFSKHLGYEKKLQRKRVNIILGNGDGISSFKSITSICVENPFIPGIEMSEIDRINQTLKIIHQGLTIIGSKEGWYMDRIEKAYQLAIQDNGHFVWTSELKSNRKKSHKARLIFTLENEGMVKIMSEITENRSGDKYEIFLIETFPHFFDWEQTFNKPIWIDDIKYGFSLLDSQLLIFGDIDTRQSRTVISEASWTKEEIEGHLRMLTFRKISNSKDFAEWANR